MLRNLFARLMAQNTTPSILQNETEDQAFVLEHLPNFTEPCLLRVGKMQQACLLQNGWRSVIYREGEHPLSARELSALNPQAALSIVFINTKQLIIRQWRYPELNIHGDYQLKITQAEPCLSHLLSLSTHLELASLDTWLTQQIQHIMQEQAISKQDTQQYPQRLASFLQGVLNVRFLASHGINLENFSLEYQEDEQTDQTAMAAIAPTKEEQIAPIIENRSIDDSDDSPAEFYCALNGMQQGPYRQDDIQSLIDQGIINANTLVWKLGLSSWRSLRQFSEFQWNETQ